MGWSGLRWPAFEFIRRLVHGTRTIECEQKEDCSRPVLVSLNVEMFCLNLPLC
jgi:hypothetical protein